jgi:hypothetical protein
MLDLGAEGRITLFLSSLSPSTLMAKVPKLVGPLSGAKYDMIAQAQASPTDDEPKSVLWQRNVNFTSTVMLSGWLLPPSGLSAAPATLTFGFTGATGATVHSLEIDEGPALSRKRVWSVLLADGSTMVTLPALTPDPLPATGTALHMKVGALDLPGFDLNNFKIDDAQKFIARIAEDDLNFTR